MPLVEPISNFEANAGTFKGGRNLGAKGKAGRPAQAGERYPSGQLKPQKDRNAGTPPAQIKRLFDAALRGAADPIYGTSLGLLYAGREISTQELAAGTAYAKLRGRFDRVMGIPGRFTLSPDYGTGRAISSREPMTEREVAQVKKRHCEMMGAIHASMAAAVYKADERAQLKGGGVRLVSPEGQRAQIRTTAERTVALLDRVCVEDLACESFETVRLKAALQRLVPFFGISC